MDRLLNAIDFAAKKHKNQRRKDANATPYINHPIEVTDLLAQAAVTDVDILMAAVLHDTIEDTKTSFEELVNNFGLTVANIVMECTDDKSLPKETRKQLQISHAETMSTAAKLVKLADKYSNLSDLASNPPTSWRPEEIRGYAIWCFAVFLKLKGSNHLLEEKLWKLFDELGVTKITNLEEQLQEYYTNIRKSD